MQTFVFIVDDRVLQLVFLFVVKDWRAKQCFTRDQAVKKANENLDEYKFGELADMCYEFTWNNLCDWYVEYAKKQLRDPELADNTRRILLHVLSGTLRMQHPIMPFITEEIYQKLPHQPSKSVMLADYPVADTSLIDEKINSDTDFVLETVRALRNIRQQYNVPPKQAVKAMIG